MTELKRVKFIEIRDFMQRKVQNQTDALFYIRIRTSDPRLISITRNTFQGSPRFKNFSA
jgi:hypothetical protein